MNHKFYQVLLVSSLIGSCGESKFRESTTQSTARSEEAQPAVPAPVQPTEPDSEPIPSAPAPSIPERDTTVEFGASEVFHIGDGAIGAQSACVNEVKTFDLTGTTYFFEFEVAEDDTSLDLSIGKICGIDAEGMTSISLINTANSALELSEVILATDRNADRSTAFTPYPTFKLNRGLYSVVVTTKNVLGKPKPPAGTPVGGDGSDEYDDFIVGAITIKADKAVKASRIYTE